MHWHIWTDRQGMKIGPKNSLTCRIKVLGFACCVVLGTVSGVFSPLSFVLNFYMDQLSEMGWCLSCHWCIRGISCHFCWTLVILCLVGLFLCCLVLVKVEVGSVISNWNDDFSWGRGFEVFSFLGVCAFWLRQSWARGFYESIDLSGFLTMEIWLIPCIYPSNISLKNCLSQTKVQRFNIFSAAHTNLRLSWEMNL